MAPKADSALINPWHLEHLWLISVIHRIPGLWGITRWIWDKEGCLIKLGLTRRLIPVSISPMPLVSRIALWTLVMCWVVTSRFLWATLLWRIRLWIWTRRSLYPLGEVICPRLPLVWDRTRLDLGIQGLGRRLMPLGMGTIVRMGIISRTPLETPLKVLLGTIPVPMAMGILILWIIVSGIKVRLGWKPMPLDKREIHLEGVTRLPLGINLSSAVQIQMLVGIISRNPCLEDRIRLEWIKAFLGEIAIWWDRVKLQVICLGEVTILGSEIILKLPLDRVVRLEGITIWGWTKETLCSESKTRTVKKVPLPSLRTLIREITYLVIITPWAQEIPLGTTLWEVWTRIKEIYLEILGIRTIPWEGKAVY